MGFQTAHSYMENVIFDIYGTTYIDDVSQDIINASPTVAGLKGHLQDTFLSPAPETGGMGERSRTSTVRLVVHLTLENETALTNGCIIQITHKKNRRTRSWEDVSSLKEQYIANFDSDVSANGNYRVLSLLTKNIT